MLRSFENYAKNLFNSPLNESILHFYSMTIFSNIGEMLITLHEKKNKYIIITHTKKRHEIPAISENKAGEIFKVFLHTEKMTQGHKRGRECNFYKLKYKMIVRTAETVGNKEFNSDASCATTVKGLTCLLLNLCFELHKHSTLLYNF